MNKNIVVVLKANAQIGTGHLMRVKGLLPYLKQYNLYLCSDSLSEELRQNCSEYKQIYVIPNIKDLADKILSINPSLVIIDHYYLDYKFEELLYERTKIVVIDDLQNRKHLCHLLIDQNDGNNKYKDLVPNSCRLCIGSKYNLIKKEFFNIKKIKDPLTVPNILVNFGGADPVHACKITAESIIQGKLFNNFKFIILCGVSNPDYEYLKELTNDFRYIKIIKNSDNVPDLFSKIDFAIGACGGMFRERIAAQIPSINVEIADNQKGACDFVKKNKLGECAKLSELSNYEIIGKKISRLIENKDLYQKNCREMIKGNGIELVIREIQALL